MILHTNVNITGMLQFLLLFRFLLLFLVCAKWMTSETTTVPRRPSLFHSDPVRWPRSSFATLVSRWPLMVGLFNDILLTARVKEHGIRKLLWIMLWKWCGRLFKASQHLPWGLRKITNNINWDSRSQINSRRRDYEPRAVNTGDSPKSKATSVISLPSSKNADMIQKNKTKGQRYGTAVIVMLDA
jgi:hypothetical protein